MIKTPVIKFLFIENYQISMGKKIIDNILFNNF